MDISRRQFFIGGAAFASLGAFGGNRFMLAAANAAAGAGTPRLRFGVLSDIHVRDAAKPGDTIENRVNELTFVKALEWFRDKGADAVVVAGDMADSGLVEQLKLVAAAWEKVFPGGKAPDGRKVERIFVYGNHDMGGVPYARKRFKDLTKEEIALRTIYNDPKGSWEKIFGEPFEPIFSKEVKGYRFVGAHWWSQRGCNGRNEGFNGGIGEWYAAHSKEFDPSLPFFHVQHPHPKDTCYGPWAWGHDVGLSTKTLSAFPNAVAFSGHSHYALTDERSVWQGAFTSVGTGSLRYTGMPLREFPFDGRPKNPADCRNGMLWSVYGDRIVAERREFLSDLPLGDAWVMPLPAAESRPFAFAESAGRSMAPQYAKGAKLAVSASKPNAKSKGWLVSAPAPAQNQKGRLFRIVFEAELADGRKIAKNVLAEGFNHSMKHKRAQSKTSFFFKAADFGESAPVRFSATPYNCFGKAGTAISAKV